MKFFRIAKWEKYQHYHKPRPPWLKVYTSINDLETDWRPLKDHQLGQLLRLMAYAALNDNAMPFDNDLIMEQLDFDQQIDLKVFAKLKVITVFPSRSSCLSREKSRIKSRENPIAPSSEVRDQRIEVKEQRKKDGTPPKIPDGDEKDGIEIRELTQLFIDLRLENDPGARIPGILMPWESLIGKIHFTDKRSYSQIRDVIQFSQTDEFWRSNILEPRELRHKFQKLVLDMKRGTGKKTVTDKNKEFLENYLGSKGEVHERET